MNKLVIPNSVTGLNPETGEMQTNYAVFKYVYGKEKTAPIPKGSVGQCDSLRKRILQVSIYPDIYTKVKKVKHPGNTDFGEMD